MAKQMEQFDKWWNEINKHPHCSLPRYKWQAEPIWKAALRWVQDTKYRDTDESLYDLLKEELGDEY